jgi:hypothetical protein
MPCCILINWIFVRIKNSTLVYRKTRPYVRGCNQKENIHESTSRNTPSQQCPRKTSWDIERRVARSFRGRGGLLVHRFRSSNHIDIINQPRPEERALARVSKDGRRQGRATASILRDAMLRMAPQDEVRGIKFDVVHLIGFMESIH